MNTSRLAYIDNLRVFMIVLVVLMHSAVTYSGMGMWYYTEQRSLDTASKLLFGIFQSFTQAYFMSLLFMIAGYFIPGSIDKKGVGRYVADRLFRLGIPILAFVFIVHPLCVKLSHPELSIMEYFALGIRSFDFIGWTGPLWFALALLLFTFAYLPLRKMSAGNVARPRRVVTVKSMLALVFMITAVAFAVRIIFPIGSAVINLQVGFFPAYIALFIAGVTGYRRGLFDMIDYESGKRWCGAALAIGLPFWIVLMVFGGPLEGKFSINGGWNWQAFAYALWESFFCVTFSFGLVGVFKHRLNARNPFLTFLSNNAFGVYVFHAPVLIGVSMLLRDIEVYPPLKCTVVAAAAISFSFLFSSAIRSMPLLRRIFS